MRWIDYSAAVRAYSSLVSYWRLGELSGTVATDSAGANNGTYQGAPTLGVPGLVLDDPNTAVTFNGITQYVDMGNAASLQISTGTITCWAQVTGTPAGGYHEIIGKQNAYLLTLNGSMLEAYDYGTSNDRSTGVNLADAKIHNVAMTFQSGVANGTVVYIDGQPVLTTTITVLNQTLNFHVGGVPGFFPGTIDEVVLYNTALTGAQITTLYQAGITALLPLISIPPAAVIPGAV